MSEKWPTQITGKRQIGLVIKYLDYQRSITGNVTGDNFAGFHINNVPGADDESSFHVAKSILRKLANEGYLKFTDTTSIIELNNFCVVEFLPKYRWIKFKYFFAVDPWKLTNPFWLIWLFVKNVTYVIILLWEKSRLLTALIAISMSALVYDWSLAWQNAKTLFKLLGLL